MGYGEIRFGSLDEVIKGAHLRSLDEGKEMLKKGFDMCLERGKEQRRKCSRKALACALKRGKEQWRKCLSEAKRGSK